MTLAEVGALYGGGACVAAVMWVCVRPLMGMWFMCAFLAGCYARGCGEPPREAAPLQAPPPCYGCKVVAAPGAP